MGTTARSGQFVSVLGRDAKRALGGVPATASAGSKDTAFFIGGDAYTFTRHPCEIRRQRRPSRRRHCRRQCWSRRPCSVLSGPVDVVP